MCTTLTNCTPFTMRGCSLPQRASEVVWQSALPDCAERTITGVWPNRCIARGQVEHGSQLALKSKSNLG